jgi:hypothetical protein
MRWGGGGSRAVSKCGLAGYITPALFVASSRRLFDTANVKAEEAVVPNHSSPV